MHEVCKSAQQTGVSCWFSWSDNGQRLSLDPENQLFLIHAHILRQKKS